MSRSLLAFDLGDSLKLGTSGTAVGGVNQGSTASVGSTYRDVATFLNLLVPLAFVIAGIILLVLLVGGGFSIVASGGNAKSVESGKNQIMSAVIGFVIIFAAYWIIQIIQAFTGVPILNATL